MSLKVRFCNLSNVVLVQLTGTITVKARHAIGKKIFNLHYKPTLIIILNYQTYFRKRVLSDIYVYPSK